MNFRPQKTNKKRYPTIKSYWKKADFGFFIHFSACVSAFSLVSCGGIIEPTSYISSWEPYCPQEVADYEANTTFVFGTCAGAPVGNDLQIIEDQSQLESLVVSSNREQSARLIANLLAQIAAERVDFARFNLVVTVHGENITDGLELSPYFENNVYEKNNQVFLIFDILNTNGLCSSGTSETLVTMTIVPKTSTVYDCIRLASNCSN